MLPSVLIIHIRRRRWTHRRECSDWFWHLDINNDDGLIGPFMSREEAEKDARETLGIAHSDD
jgi:hypothetical protein